jgi:hypothetical protein
MQLFKKLIFALPFLIFFGLFCLNLNNFLQNINLLFSLDLKELLKSLYLVLYLLLALMFFMIFATFAKNWKLVLPIAFLASIFPIFLITPLNYLLIFGFFLSFLITYFPFETKLNNYLTFKANSLLIPTIKSLSTLIILVSSLVFYFFASEDLKINGFKIPDSIIDPVINIASQGSASNNLSIDQLSLSPDQINLLKQNPELLAQYGLDPKILDQVTASKPQTFSQNDLIKTSVNSQFQSIISPNLWLVSIVLAILFFVSLNFLSSFLILLIYPLIYIIFWILEKTGFITFEVEMRPVKKLVV